MGLVEHVTTILQDFKSVSPTVLFSVPALFNRIYDGINNQLASKPQIIRSAFDKTLALRKAKLGGERLTLLDQAVLAVLDKVVLGKIRATFGGKLRIAFVGGAAMDADIMEMLDALGITVYEGYGATETSPISTLNTPGARKYGSVGRPIQGVEALVVASIDEESGEVTLAGVGEPGELCIAGDNVMKEYYNNPKATAEAVVENAHVGGNKRLRLYRSGDLAVVDSEGFISITGRIKEQFKLENGKFVVPAPTGVTP